MFDIGFSELLLLSIVALLVLGPEKLPGAIRTTSLWVGRLRRSFNTIKLDIEREIGADEIRRQLRNEAIMDKFKQTKAQVNDAVNTVKNEIDAIRKNVELEAQMAAFTSNAPPPKTAPPEAANVPATTAPVSLEAATPKDQSDAQAP